MHLHILPAATGALASMNAVWTGWLHWSQRASRLGRIVARAIESQPAGSRHPPEKVENAPMSASTTAPAPSPSLSDIASSVRSAASWAMQGLATISNDWAAIKASPLYGPLAAIAVKAAESELAANNVPVTPLVNIAGGVEDELNALAKLHPAISAS